MLEIKSTSALKHFKYLLGQTNHYLITILIGLEGVREGHVLKGESFNVSWNPKSVEDSVKRSRLFARNAALSWAIDSLDAYMGFLLRQPFCISDATFIDEFSDRSVYKRFKALVKYLDYETDISVCLVHLGIQWRNNLVHFHAENELDQKYATFLRNIDKKDIERRFCGLDAQKMLEGFKNNQSPTLKEVASIIQAIHYLVVEMDKRLIKDVDAHLYCKTVINQHISDIESLLKNEKLSLRKISQFFTLKGLVSCKDFTRLDRNMILEQDLLDVCIESIASLKLK